MRAWIYDTLIASTDLQAELGGVEGIKTRVMPRRSQESTPPEVDKPFIIFGLGNDTNELLTDSTADDEDGFAHRQFWQIWVHDEDSSYVLIDDLVEVVKNLFLGASSPAHKVLTTRWLETSQEFNNQTYGTNFRYIRFQSIIAKGVQGT